MRSLLLIATIAFSSVSFAQSPAMSTRHVQGGAPQWSSQAKSLETCGPVVNNYLGFIKTPTVWYFHQDTNYWYTGAAQYYDAPQDITVHGVSFFAHVGANSADSIKVYTELYSAGADSTPQTLLAIDSVWVTGHSYSSFLPNVQYTGSFTSPVTVSGPYCVAVRSTPVDTLFLYSNDPNTGGQGENLGSIYYGVPSVPAWHGWYRSWTASLDMDYLVLPVVSYDAFGPVNLATGTNQFCDGEQVCLTYSQGAVHANRMYSFDNANPAQSIRWVWGDGNYVEDLSSVCHAYSVGGNYDIILTDTLSHMGLNSGECIMNDTVSIDIWEDVTAAFSWSNTGYTVDFTNLSTYDTASMWYFGDGDSSSLSDPSHTFASATSYDVTLIADGFCGIDTVVIQVDLTFLSLEDNQLEEVEIYPNPTQDKVRISGVPSHTRFTLTNVLGKEVATGRVGEGHLNLSDLSSGMYLLRLELEGEVMTKRVVKK